MELGYVRYALVDGYGGGDVHGGFLGGYIVSSAVRLGAQAELGVRDYTHGPGDGVIRVSASLGYQHLRVAPFVPYAAVVISGGIVFGKRFHTPVAHVLTGAGLEVGADVRVFRTVSLGLGLSYLRANMRGNGYDLFVLRLRVGL